LISPVVDCAERYPARKILISANSGFRFLPPSDLFDVTFGMTSHVDQLKVLLLCRSGFDSNAPGWPTLVIETFSAIN
jgi:hypothetical protein